MRFTLQHILLWQCCCLILIAINQAIGGRCDIWQGTITLATCGAGCVWGIRRHRKKHPDVPLAPLASVAKGIAMAVALSLLLGLVFGNQRYEICTRTFCARSTRNLGVLNPATVQCTDEAEFIRDMLKFVPSEHNWVTTVTYSNMAYADYFPSHRFPILELEMDDLRRLAHLEKVEQCHALFQLDNPQDIKLAKVRQAIFLDLERRCGDSDAEIVRGWWKDFEPLLRPIKSDAELQNDIADWRALPPTQAPNMYVYLSEELKQFEHN